MRTIRYHLSPVSPWVYLGHERFLSIAGRFGAAVEYRPVDLGQVFPSSGGLPLAKRAPQRQAYRLAELRRWSQYLGVPLVPQPRTFPAPDEWAALAIVAADRTGLDAGRLVGALGRALWADERPIGERETVAAIAAEIGMPADLLDRSDVEVLRARRQIYTEEAMTAGVFGVPTYELDGELFWGQDRLDFLERALDRS